MDGGKVVFEHEGAVEAEGDATAGGEVGEGGEEGLVEGVGRFAVLQAGGVDGGEAAA